MNSLSGLNETARSFVGRTLKIQFVYGWGWSVHAAANAEAKEFADIDKVNMTWAHVIPSEFFSHGGAATRGFLGRILEPEHILHEMPVLALTMSDGVDYDFTSQVCPVWRFFFGQGELILPQDSFPRLRGLSIIGGCGRVNL